MSNHVRLSVAAKATLPEVRKLIGDAYDSEPPKAGKAVEIAIRIARGFLSGALEKDIAAKVCRDIEQRLEDAYATRAIALISQALEDLHPGMVAIVNVDTKTREISVGLADGPIRKYSTNPDSTVCAS